MGKIVDILRVGRRDLKFIYQPGVYLLFKRRWGGQTQLLVVGESPDIGREARLGGVFSTAELLGVDEAIVVIERNPDLRRRLAGALARRWLAAKGADVAFAQPS